MPEVQRSDHQRSDIQRTDIQRPDLQRWTYLESLDPGTGTMAPRARLESSAPEIDLSGTWRFQWSADLAGTTDGFERPDFDDVGWDEIAVPSCWQLVSRNDGRYGRPAYHNSIYPIPVDPPHVPDENPTGEYRRTVEIPADWAGQPAVLRFDGVDSAFEVFLAGVRLGDAKGSRLVHEFEVGPLLPGPVVVAVRVHQWSSASYLEDQDTWRVSGIFRGVWLQQRPAGGVSDVFVHADYDHLTKTGRLAVETDDGATLSVPGLGIDGPAGQVYPDLVVQPWTAETPVLYDASVGRGGETVSLRIGFRTVRIVDSQLFVNGSVTHLRGVNHHDWHPRTGRTLDLATIRRDVELIKGHGFNAVRTSHYPPDHRMLTLCDEYGLWVMDECDLETHGFEEAPELNPARNPDWLPAMLDRIARTIERDKNHPSVIAWSLGNESLDGDNLQRMADWAGQRDPSRFVSYERAWDVVVGDVAARMYTPHTELEGIGRGSEPLTPDAAADARRRTLPFVLIEFAHAMGNGPGALRDYQDILDAHPRLIGGFIWEWVDQGIEQTIDATTRFGYGGDFGEEYHDGVFIMDGLVFADRTPSPGLIDAAAVMGDLKLTVDVATGTLEVFNRRDHTDTADLAWDWTLEVNGDVTTAGVLNLEAVAPRTTRRFPLPEWGELDLAAGAEAFLTVRAATTRSTPWDGFGSVISAGQSRIARGADPEPAASQPLERLGSGFRLGQAEFDDRGRLLRIGDLAVGSPVLDLWRAPTDNDGPNWGPNQDAQAWRQYGLHRIHQRFDGIQVDDDSISVAMTAQPGGRAIGFRWTVRWRAESDELRMTVRAEPFGSWPFPVPRIGVRMAVPDTLHQVDWFGAGPHESYPDTNTGLLIGRYSTDVSGLQTPYARPQENGNRRDVRWMSLTNATGQGLLLRAAAPINVSVRPWTSETLDAAAHPTELVPDDRLWLNLDAAVHGIGSGACGPRVLPQHTLTARPMEWTVLFRLL